MATQLNLMTVTQDHEYIKKIKKALEKAVGQDIPIINIEKVRRVSGSSVLPVGFVFAGGQELKLYVRAGADVTKGELNGKTIVLSGDFSNDYQQTFDRAVEYTAKTIRANQKKFETSRNKQKVVIPKQEGKTAVRRSVAMQLKEIKEKEAQLDKEIEAKKVELDLLQQQYNQALEQRQTPKFDCADDGTVDDEVGFDGLDDDEQGEFDAASEDNQTILGKSIQQINQQFNDELQDYVVGKLDKSHVFQLGMPSRILRTYGKVPNKPIELSASHAQFKASLKRHRFDMRALKHLPKALQNPIAIFKYDKNPEHSNVIAPLSYVRDGVKRYMLVGVKFDVYSDTQHILVNSIRGLFPKDAWQWINWIDKDKALYLDVKKVKSIIKYQRDDLMKYEPEYFTLSSIDAKLAKWRNK